MSHDDTTLVLGMDDIQPSESLPEFVSRRWNFPLQQHERDDTKYYNIRDWIAGITDSTPGKARVAWKDFKRLHENAGGVVSLASPTARLMESHTKPISRTTRACTKLPSD